MDARVQDNKGSHVIFIDDVATLNIDFSHNGKILVIPKLSQDITLTLRSDLSQNFNFTTIYGGSEDETNDWQLRVTGGGTLGDSNVIHLDSDNNSGGIEVRPVYSSSGDFFLDVINTVIGTRIDAIYYNGQWRFFGRVVSLSRPWFFTPS